MSFDARNFYDLALWLIEQKTDESYLRTAISRTYFAGHLRAVQKLTKRGWNPKGKGEDHGGVIRELKRGRTTQLSNYLNHLRMLREHADYHLDSFGPGGEQDCQFCRKVRESSALTDQNVTLSHWQDAKEVGERCFPLIEKLWVGS